MQNVPFSSNKPYLFRAIYEWLLDNQATPYMLVDATQPEVRVPNEHVQNGQIILNTSPSAIHHWAVDNHAVSFSARFSGQARNIYVPMDAILAVYAQENGLGMAFPPVEKSTIDAENEQSIDDLGDLDAEPMNSSHQEQDSVVQQSKNKPKAGAHLKVIK